MNNSNHKECLRDVVCKDHSCLCCSGCINADGGHGKCRTAPLDSAVVKEIQDRLSRTTKSLEESLEKLEDFSPNNLENWEDPLEGEVNKVKTNISETFDSLRMILDKREKQLLTEVEQVYDKNSLDGILKELTDTKEKIYDIISQGRAIEERDWGSSELKDMASQSLDVISASEELTGDIGRTIDRLSDSISLDLSFDSTIIQGINSLGEFSSTLTKFKQEISVVSSIPGGVVLSWNPSPLCERYQVKSQKCSDNTHSISYEGSETGCRIDGLEHGKKYAFCVRGNVGGLWGSWSEKCTAHIRGQWEDCVWAKCIEGVDSELRYETELRVATKAKGTYGSSTVIGTSFLPESEVSSWKIRMLSSLRGDWGGVFVGVAPYTINKNDFDNFEKCGWYLGCYSLRLTSGPPHNYSCKYFGQMATRYKHLSTEDNVGVVMNTTKGELSFSVNGTNLGVAYEGIPLDEPLVPCVILTMGNDSVELII